MLWPWAASIAAAFVLDGAAKPAHAGAFSGKNGHIAFTSFRESANQEIYSMNPDGTSQANLTNHPAGDDYQSAYSPSSKQIAFESGRDGNSEIYKMSSTGGPQTDLTNKSAPDREPDWQPLP